jgi:glycogen synthase
MAYYIDPYKISNFPHLSQTIQSQSHITAYETAARDAYRSAEDFGRKVDRVKLLMNMLENPGIDNNILLSAFRDQFPEHDPLFKELCLKVSKALGDGTLERGKQLLEENLRCLLRIKNYDGVSLLDQLKAHLDYQLENYRGIAELNTLWATLEKHKSCGPSQFKEAATYRTRASDAYEKLPNPAKEALGFRIYELDGGGNKGDDYGNRTILNWLKEQQGIENLLSHNASCPIKDAIDICTYKTTNSPNLIATYFHTEGIKDTDIGSPISNTIFAEIKKLNELEDLSHFIHDPFKDNNFRVGKYKNAAEAKNLIAYIYWLARYQPDILNFSEDAICSDLRMLLDIQDENGKDILSQLIEHQKGKIEGLRIIAELEKFLNRAYPYRHPRNNKEKDDLRHIFNTELSDKAQECLRFQVWYKDGGSTNPTFGWTTYGKDKIDERPSILFDDGILSTAISALKARVFNADNVMKDDIKVKRPVPQGPVDASSEKLSADKSLCKEVPENLKVAYVTAELDGVASMGGLGSAVKGMAGALGKGARVIMPLYRSASDNPAQGPINYGKIIQYLKRKSDYDSNDGTGKIWSMRIDGIKCYFIDIPELFSIPPKPDGSSGNLYEGEYYHNMKRWAVFQRAAADLVSKLSNPPPRTDSSKPPKVPVHLVHLHDAQTALVPKFLALRDPGKWKWGETPATMLTIHNNQVPMEYKDDRSIDILARLDLPRRPTNSLVEGIHDVDMISTVSKTHAKEIQGKRDGNGMQAHMKQAASEERMVGITNGNTNGFDPSKEDQLEKWISVLDGPNKGKPIDLRFSPDDPPEVFAEKMRTRQRELCAYLKIHGYANLDPEKPIVMYVGRYDWTQKGIDKFEMIAEQVIRNGGQFVCVGTEPGDSNSEATKMLKRIQDFANQRGKNGVFALIDERQNGQLVHQSKFGKLLRAAASLAIFPSLREPCGLVQGEMGKYSVPVIATRTGGFIDTLTTEGDDANGYLFDRVGESHEDWFTSPEQANKINEEIRRALEVAKAMQYALYHRSLNEQLPYIERKKRIMRNALNSTWEKTPNGKDIPIVNYYYAYGKAFRHRKTRGRTILKLKSFQP